MNPEFHNLMPDFKLFALTAFIPLAIGMVWYNPRVFGKVSMAAAGVTEENMKGANMILTFGLTYVFSYFMSVALGFAVIHQTHLYSLIAVKSPPIPPDSINWINNALAHYGGVYRTYKHGAFHGFVLALTIILPVIGINGLFEHRGFKYIAVHFGFWAVCCMLMGGIICHWASIS